MESERELEIWDQWTLEIEHALGKNNNQLLTDSTVCVPQLLTIQIYFLQLYTVHVSEQGCQQWREQGSSSPL